MPLTKKNQQLDSSIASLSKMIRVWLTSKNTVLLFFFYINNKLLICQYLRFDKKVICH